MEHFYKTIPGWFHFEEAYRRLLSILPTQEPSTFVEVGSYQGMSAAYLGVEILNHKLPVYLHCVDSWQDFMTPQGIAPGVLVKATFEKHMAPLVAELGERLTIHHKPSVEAAADLAAGVCDVVWIDGGHEYKDVKADIAAWWPKVKTGGWIGGDDWMMPDVQRAVGEAFAPAYMLGHGWASTPEHPQGTYWPWWLVHKVE